MEIKQKITYSAGQKNSSDREINKYWVFKEPIQKISIKSQNTYV